MIKPNTWRRALRRSLRDLSSLNLHRKLLSPTTWRIMALSMGVVFPITLVATALDEKLTRLEEVERQRVLNLTLLEAGL